MKTKTFTTILGMASLLIFSGFLYSRRTSRGSELYWGKTWVSLENKQIEHAEMYSNTIQEMDIKDLDDKIVVSTNRILNLEKIK